MIDIYLDAGTVHLWIRNSLYRFHHFHYFLLLKMLDRTSTSRLSNDFDGMASCFQVIDLRSEPTFYATSPFPTV